VSYFDATAVGPPQGALRVVKGPDLARFGVVDGIDIAPVLGARLNVNIVKLAPDAIAEVHAHDEEQIGIVVDGSIRFTDGTSTWDLGPGDCYHAPSAAPHGGVAGPAGCTIVDAFSPPRSGIAELLEG
jgi:quercetin dioxygenase-like cupin family protein